VFFCERCESSFNATIAAASGDCPRCKENEGVKSPLRFRLFEPSDLKVAGLSPTRSSSSAPHSQPVKQ
jgi:hypothetical protein